MAKSDDRMIRALPTKKFFIEMLTRDIALIPAIADLVDNCVDGLHRLKKRRSYDGYYARIDFSKSGFSIQDNCGGIPLEVAREYAFRFGRPDEHEIVPNGLGRFGIGMKRAVFKMGKDILVESCHGKVRYAVSIPVTEWAASEDNWTFEFSELRRARSEHPASEWGTTITVKRLYRSVQEDFALGKFARRLVDHLETRLRHAISRGLEITVNGERVEARPLTLLDGPNVRPAYDEFRARGKSGGMVNVRLYCGLGRAVGRGQARREAGWYVFCNGRTLLEADQSDATVWGDVGARESAPGFHPQFNLLRGYAFFEARDGINLPWNTTKTDIDLDSDLYRAAQLRMVTLSRGVIDFLNARKKDMAVRKRQGLAESQFAAWVRDAESTSVEDVVTRKRFLVPKHEEIDAPDEDDLVEIKFRKPSRQVDRMRRHYRVRHAAATGKRAFEEVYRREFGRG